METVYDVADAAQATSYHEGRMMAEQRLREKDERIAALDAENDALVEVAAQVTDVADGLVEVAQLAADNEQAVGEVQAQLEDVVTALMEVAEIVGGEDGEAVLPED